jgi:anti-sigma factor RsiW
VTCRELAEFIAEYVAGELAPETTAQFEDHLARCANCRAYVANYSDTIRLGRAAFADNNAEVPDDVPEDLVKAILASRRR